ncbi:hypothetical protein [Helicobacter bizzozeronii]|uniref:hypothetical protein n=1 Tax=Helicobacter bizzozeronii TaxID=56877 RepID=UPI0013152B95|nr:hypothetical protein [Helicobacter bizzozeronii]
MSIFSALCFLLYQVKYALARCGGFVGFRAWVEKRGWLVSRRGFGGLWVAFMGARVTKHAITARALRRWFGRRA